MAEAKPFSDEELEGIKKNMGGKFPERCFLATITARDKRIEELETDIDTSEKRITSLEEMVHKEQESVADQTAVIERLRGENKEMGDLLQQLVKMDIDYQMRKTIANFHKRQRQALDAGKED